MHFSVQSLEWGNASKKDLQNKWRKTSKCWKYDEHGSQIVKTNQKSKQLFIPIPSLWYVYFLGEFWLFVTQWALLARTFEFSSQVFWFIWPLRGWKFELRGQRPRRSIFQPRKGPINPKTRLENSKSSRQKSWLCNR